MKHKISAIFAVITFCLCTALASCNFFSGEKKSDVTSPDSVVNDTTKVIVPPDSLETEPQDSLQDQ